MPEEHDREESPPLTEEPPRPEPQASDDPVDSLEMSEEMRGAFDTVVENVQARRAEAGESPAPPPRPIEWIIAAGASWALLGLILLVPPPFAHPPAPRGFMPPAELRSASLRFGLWLARGRVDAFTRLAARVPSYAGEAGVDDPAIMIESLGDRRYKLSAKDGAVRLQLTSEMAVDSFLGESLTQLRASAAYQQAGTPGSTTAR